jgi:hypothetical protein
MSTSHNRIPTTILAAQKCWRMKKDGTALVQRGGKGLISIKLYPPLVLSNPQPFMQADQGCMDILRMCITCKAIKHSIQNDTVVINGQDWAHRESLKNTIKPIFFLKLKSIARADFFIEIWNEQFDAYEAHQTVSEISEISEDVEESVATAAATTTADRSVEKIDGDTNFGEDHGHYSDEDDLFPETQPTSEPYRFDLKRK